MKNINKVMLIAACVSAMNVMAQDAQPSKSNRIQSGIEEIVTTAQKREQNVNDVGMTIDTASGKKIKDFGITDTFDIGKLVSGFTANLNYYGSPVYTIRGVGFQDTALASPQTVSVNIDQMPIPFAAMTNGAILCLLYTSPSPRD